MATTTQRAARKQDDTAPAVASASAFKARRKYLRDLAKAPRSVRLAAIAASARAMAHAPEIPEETEFTDALGGEDFLDCA